MFFKFFSSLKTCIYSHTADTVYVNLLIGSEWKAPFGTVTLDGKRLQVACDTPTHLTVKIRIPEYSRNFRATVPGRVENGYYVIEKTWQAGDDTVEFDFDQPIVRLQAHPLVSATDETVHENHTRLCVQYGPHIYCAEGRDNGDDVAFRMAANTTLALDDDRRIHGKTAVGGEFTLVPYYTWCNRGKNVMAVWLEQEDYEQSVDDLEGWEGKLYRVWKEEA
jgi:DUF1680 family protein